jgi:PAS domain S-box-containing protein
MAGELRKRVEELLQGVPRDITRWPSEDVRAVLDELRGYQVELELQNDALRRAQRELAEIRDHYADLYELAPVAYVTLDGHQIIREANITFTALMGCERQEVLGRGFSSFVAPHHRDEVLRSLRLALNAGTEQLFKVQFQHQDRRQFWGLVKCIPSNSARNRPEAYRVTVADISALKTSEAMLQESKERLELALEAGAMGLWDLDLEKNQIVWNDQLYRLLGYPAPVDITPETFFGHIHADDRSRVRLHVEDMLRAGTGFADEFRIVRKDGAVRWFATRARLKRGSHGKPVRMTGINYDATIWKETEAYLEQLVQQRADALAVSERLYRDLVENTNDIVYSMDSDGVMLFVSHQVERYALRVDDVVGQHYLDIVAVEDRGRIETDLRRAFATGEEFPSLFRLRNPDDRLVWMESKGHLRQDASGRVVGLTGVLRDVTERVAAEQENLRQREALGMLASRLGEAQEEERQRIAAGLHDEVAQLLAACQIKLAEARNCDDPSERDRLLEAANGLLDEASDEIRGLTFELRSPALFESGLVAAIRELCGHVTKRYGLEIEMNGAAEALAVPQRLRPALYHCLRELLHNVVKHAKVEKATVQISSLRGGEDVPLARDRIGGDRLVPAVEGGRSGPVSADALLEITVHDDGRGFDTAALERPLTRKGGFGLRHLRERIQEIGGRIKIESTPGSGTTAVMVVPLVTAFRRGGSESKRGKE